MKKMFLILMTAAMVVCGATNVFATETRSANERPSVSADEIDLKRPFMPTISMDDTSLEGLIVNVPLKKGYSATYMKGICEKSISEIKPSDIGLMLQDYNGEYIYCDEITATFRAKKKCSVMTVTIKKVRGKRVHGLKFAIPYKITI